VKKDYQTNDARIAIGDRVALPEAVNVAMAELAGAMKEGLLALAVGAGLQVMQAVMEEDVVAMAGPKGRHDPERTAVRHGSEAGSVTLGGRRVPVRRPRVRAIDGSGELPVPAYDLFTSTELLGQLALERMMAKLSTRRYSASLEPVGSEVAAVACSTSKSTVSRRFVQRTEVALNEMMSVELSGLDLIALMLDGVHFAETCCVVALGIGADGAKQPLGLVEGATENASVVTDLLVGLRERGLDVTRPVLVVIDGSKALASAVRAVFDRPLIQRCQLHKMRINRPLGGGSTSVLGGSGSSEVPEVVVEGGDDPVMSCGFVGPAALFGVVTKVVDVVALRGEDVGSFGVGDEVVALLTDVGVGAGAGDGVAGAEAVGDAGLDHLAVKPVDFGWDGPGVPGGNGEQRAATVDLGHGGLIGGADGGRRESGIAQGHLRSDMPE